MLIGAYIAYEVIDRSRARPPATVHDWDTYLQWQTKHRMIHVWRGAGQTFLLMSGPNAGVFPSGSTVYVFDTSGKMVDWTPDGGDDQRFEKKWYATGERQEITLDQARQRFAPSRPATMPTSR